MQSQSFIQRWKAEGHAEGLAEGRTMGILEARREDLLRVLDLRFRGLVPDDLIANIRSIEHPERLANWFDAAILSPSVELFRLTVAMMG